MHPRESAAPPGSPLLRAPTVHDAALARRYPKPAVGPQLLWPSIWYGRRIEAEDASFFPVRRLVVERYAAGKNDNALKLVAFEAAIMNSAVRILVLDPHFDENGARVLGPAFSSSQASDIRLLTSNRDTRARFKERFTRYRNLNRHHPDRIEVRWTTELDKLKFPFLHDRFAIVDGALWHFGSTVGGSHRRLTAASGPWSTAATRAVEFFEECWSTCGA